VKNALNLFAVLGLLAAMGVFFLTRQTMSAIHEIEALLCLLISVTAMAGAGACQYLEEIRNKLATIQKEMRPPQTPEL